MKRNAIIRIILFSVIAFVLLCVLLSGLGLSSFAKPVSSQIVSVQSTGEEHEFAPGEVSEIFISWASGDIDIQPADQDTVTVSEERSGGSSMVVHHQGSTLEIEAGESKWGIGFGKSTQKDLTVRVPRDWLCQRLEVSVASADVSVENMSVTSVALNTASGDCAFTDCAVEKMQVNTASGDLDYIGTLQRLEWKGASADCNLRLSDAPASIEMNTASGELNLFLPDNCGFTLDRSSLSGAFQSDFATTTENDKIVCGDGACQITFSSLSGNINICRK